MDTRIAQLRYKEVICVADGSRLGYVGDLEVDLDSGQVRALVIPGRRRLFGLLGREEDRYIPWDRGGGLGRTSSWWSRSPSLGHCAAAGERGAERERPAGHRPAGLSL